MRGEPPAASRRATDATDAAVGGSLGFALWACGWALGLYDAAGWKPAVVLPFVVAISAAAWVRGWRWPLWWAAGLGALAVALVALTPVMRGPIHAMVRRDPLPPRVDAVVVPSAGITADGLIDGTTLDRLLSAVMLLRRGVASTIVVTEPHSRPSSRGDQFRVLSLAPAGTTVLVADDVRSTRDEAVKSAALALPRGIRSIAVVTSPVHAARACATFEKAGFRVACVPADDRSTAVRTLSTPEDRLRAFQQWLYERLGMVKYRWKGWV